MTWASVAAPKKVKRSNQQPQAKKSERITVREPVMERINEMDRRTQVLRKVPPSTTTLSIINDLKNQCSINLADVIEAVVQEPLDRRRFYIVYTSVESKRANARKGFKIGDIVIPPERADVKGFIPDVPHYLTGEDMVGILSQYGEVVSGGFKTFEETSIRCGGFEFELDLHPNKRLPGQLQILNDTMTINSKDDIMLCGYCDMYGHTQRNCRKKLAAQIARADLELQQQTQGEQFGTNVEMETQEDNHGDDNEYEDNTQNPHPPAAQVQTPAPPVEVAAPATEAVANPPAGTPTPPSPALTPIHPTPEVIGSNISNITPGQGTPSTSPPATNEAVNKINPIFPSRHGSHHDKTYEELEESLNNQSRMSIDSVTKMLFGRKVKNGEELDEKEKMQVKETAWKRTMENFKYVYDDHGQYTPFMEEREKRLRAAQKT